MPEPADRLDEMDPRTFAAVAEEMWQRIPQDLKDGVDALVVEEGERGHPSLDAVYTLGECLTESWPSGYGDSGEIRSRLVLYHGSFSALAAETAGFAWEEEIWETILHELLHHREAAAGESGLDELDWATDQNFLRLVGRPFDPGFYRVIPADPDGAIRVDSEIFIEAAERRAGSVRFTWRGADYLLRVPDSQATLFVEVRNLAGGRLTVVSPPRVGILKRLIGASGGADVEHLARRALPVLLARIA
jgi:predicted Zn-dependent protease with MMP-like domain